MEIVIDFILKFKCGTRVPYSKVTHYHEFIATSESETSLIHLGKGESFPVGEWPEEIDQMIAAGLDVSRKLLIVSMEDLDGN